MNFDNFKYHVSKIPSDNVAKEFFFAEVRQQIANDLNTNPKYEHFFKNYQPESVKRFKDFFIDQYIEICRNYELYLFLSEHDKELQFREETEYVFRTIKQKKLFNQQLLWRSGNLGIPNLNTGYHFIFWGNTIDQCPFIDLITPQDIEAMKQFLVNDNFNLPKLYEIEWQNYDVISEKDENDDYTDIPEWYEFYDNFVGTGVLLTLPDKVGEMESKYRKAYFESKPIPQNTNPNPPLPEYLWYNNKTSSEFFKLMEADEHITFLQKVYKKTRENNSRDISENELVYNAIDILRKAEEPIYLPSYLPWEQAILKGSQQYMNKMIAKELDIIYDEYLMLREMNIGANDADVVELYKNDFIINLIENQIIEGRKYLGEEENFNYLEQL